MMLLERQAYTNGSSGLVGRRVVYGIDLQEATIEGVLDGTYVLRKDDGSIAYIPCTLLVLASAGVSPDRWPQ